MFACLLKRFVPFVVALKLGVLLTMLLSPLSVPLTKLRMSVAPQEMRSRTWLVIRSVPAPDYTEREARLKGATDTLRLGVLFDADGTVSDVELLSEATQEFAADAMATARNIDFDPATEDGRPVSLWATIDYNCSSYYSAHGYTFMCYAKIVRIENDWRVTHE